MLPTLHHGVGINQSRLEHQSIVNDNRGNNNTNNTHLNGVDVNDSRLNKSRLLDYGGNLGGGGGGGVGGGVGGYSNNANDHLLLAGQQAKGTNKYGSDYSHLPQIRQND